MLMPAVEWSECAGNQSGYFMKKTFVLACLLGAFAVSSLAQSFPSAPATAPAQAGAKRVAERDAEWRKAHPGAAVAAEPKAVHKVKTKAAHSAKAGKHVKASKHAKPVKHAKASKHGKQAKHVKHAKPVKHKARKTV
jgi:hypothetical protein